MRKAGAEHVIIDSGQIAPEVRRLFPEGVHAVLELIGTATLLDSLKCPRTRGIVCYAGLLGNAWTLEKFEPMPAIPSTVRLTTYTTHIVTAANSTVPLQRIVRAVEEGRLPLNLDRVFRFDQIVAAHRYMEENRAAGKLVVVVGWSPVRLRAPHPRPFSRRAKGDTDPGCPARDVGLRAA